MYKEDCRRACTLHRLCGLLKGERKGAGTEAQTPPKGISHPNTQVRGSRASRSCSNLGSNAPGSERCEMLRVQGGFLFRERPGRTPPRRPGDPKASPQGCPPPSARPEANSTQAWRLGCLATRPPPAAEEGARPGSPFYLFLLLSAPELDAQEQQEEEEGEAPGGQVPQPPPRRPAA